LTQLVATGGLAGSDRSASVTTVTRIETRINDLVSNAEFNRRLSVLNGNINRIANDTQAATEADHRTTFVEGVKLYRKAMAWSIFLPLTVVMEDYDKSLVNSFYAFPEFRKSYGNPTPDGGRHEISSSWQSALTDGAVVDSICGRLFAGQLTERFGYEKITVLALASMSIFIFLSLFAFNIGMLLASPCLFGLSWVFS
jgi:MFS transporter, SP family, general alpha glucoside:H+ symporter